MNMYRAAALLVLLAAIAASFYTEGQPRQPEKPGIEITTVPPKGGGPDSNGTIAGRANGVRGKAFRVIVYARTDKWYVQPFADSPHTSIGDNGDWETDTHLGNEYAALLV